MANTWFQFKEFKIDQDRVAFKFGTDAALLGAWCQIDNAQSILDVGAGSGVMSLMCAQRNQESVITALEIDEPSWSQCQQNFEQSKWNRRLKAICGDFNSHQFEESFDHIICNPPFFKDSTLNIGKRVSQARHEQSLSIGKLIERGYKLLSKKGRLSIILPYDRLTEVNKLIANSSLGLEFQLNVRPTPVKQPNRVLLTMTTDTVSANMDEMELYSKESEYSDRTLQLFRPYYLNL